MGEMGSLETWEERKWKRLEPWGGAAAPTLMLGSPRAAPGGGLCGEEWLKGWGEHLTLRTTGAASPAAHAQPHTLHKHTNTHPEDTHKPTQPTQTLTYTQKLECSTLPRHTNEHRDSHQEYTHAGSLLLLYTEKILVKHTHMHAHTYTYPCGRVLSALWPQLPQLPVPRDPGTLLSACSSSAGSMSECATLYLGSTILGPAPGTLPSRIGFSLIGCPALGRKGSTRVRSCSSPEAWGLLGRRGEGRTWNLDAGSVCLLSVWRWERRKTLLWGEGGCWGGRRGSLRAPGFLLWGPL